MSDELKPCPFCGGEAKITRTRWVFPKDQIREAFAAGCDNDSKQECTGRLCFCRAYDTEAEAIAAWNARADEPVECDNIGDKCSRCGKDLPETGYTGYEYEGNYCPTCGAKVRKPEPDSRERLEEAMRNVIRDALLNLKTAIMCCVEQGMDVLNFDDAEFVDYEPEEYVDEYLSRAMRILDRQAAITECECMTAAGLSATEAPALQAKVDSLTAERDELQSIIDHMPKTEQECEACQEAHDRLMFNAKLHQDELRDECRELKEAMNRAAGNWAKKDAELRVMTTAFNSVNDKLAEKQHVCDVQRDSFLKLETENAKLRKELNKCSR